MCLSVIPMNAFATEPDPDLGVYQQQYINEYYQPILDDPSASDELKAIAQEAIEEIESAKSYDELMQVVNKCNGMVSNQRGVENFIQEKLGEYLASDETKDLAQECADKILAAEDWEEIYAIWDEYEPALRLPKDIEDSIANLTEEFLNSDECSDEMKALVQDIIDELRTVTTVEEYDAIGDKFESAMNLQRDKDEFIAMLTEDFLDSGECSDEMKALVQDSINEIKAATTAEELEELMEEIESAIVLQYEKDKAIAFLTEGYLNSDEYSDDTKALVRDTIDEIKAVTTMEELDALEGKFENMMDLQEAKEEAIAEAGEVLTSDKESDEMKALAQRFIDEVKAATTMEELEEIEEKYDPLILLQYEKDCARKEVKKLLPEDASNAVKKIVSDACAAIQGNDDPSQYDSIIEAAAKAIEAQLEKEAELAPAKEAAIAEINDAKTSTNVGVVKAAIAAINDAQSEEEISTLKTQALADMAKVDALTAPKVSISKADGKIKLSWAAVSGANKYWIYRSTDGKNFSYYTSTTKTSYTNNSVTSGTKYYYKVKAVVTINGANYAGAYSAVKSTVPMTTPTAALTVTSTGITVKWNKVTGATAYRVYRKVGSGDWKLLKTVTGTSYTNTGLTNGTKYQYKVVAVKKVGSTTYTSDASAIKTMYWLSRPTLASGTKNIATRKIVVKWNKNTKATGYQVKYIKGTTTKTVTVKGASSLTKTLSSLTKGATYKVYVRSYKTVSGVNYYSAWSGYKSVKVAK